MAKKIIYDAKNKKIMEQEFDETAFVIEPEEKIEMLKFKLSETDYQAIKYAEGQLTEEEYAPIKEQRQEWRDEINRLENKIAEEV